MAKPSALVTAFGGAFASVAGQTISMVASKFKSGYGGGSREYPAPKSLNFLLNNLFGWTDWLDSITLADGRLKQQTKTLILTPYNFGSPSGGTFGDTAITGASLSVRAPIAIPTGKRITAIRATITDNATGTTKLVVNLLSNLYGSGTSLVAASSASAGNGTKQTLSITGLTTVMTAGTALTLAIVTAFGSASCSVHAVEIDYDELS